MLRQDPDIIIIGEIQDRGTADVAVQAALTCHLVLPTLHTNDSPSADARLLELGVPAYLIRATLIGVLAQRLVRTLCPDCKSAVETNPVSWKSLQVGDALPMPKIVYSAGGCLECRQTGYLRRSGVYELMPLNAALQTAIAENPDLGNLRRLAVAAGMNPLRQAGAIKVVAGLTTVEEILALTPDLRSVDGTGA